MKLLSFALVTSTLVVCGTVLAVQGHTGAAGALFLLAAAGCYVMVKLAESGDE